MATKKVEWGIAIPQRFMVGGTDVPLLKKFVTRAEELGFHSLWAVDPYFYARKVPHLEALALLTWAAAQTERIKLGTGVIALSVHHPFHLAKGIMTLDNMSDGRFIFGVGLGGSSEGRSFEESSSYFEVGAPQGHRVGRFMENLRILKALWSDEEVVNYDGQFWKLHDVELDPKPVQRPHPPIWFGGEHPNMIRRCAKHADGWTAVGDIPNSEYKACLALLNQHLEEFGRDPALFTLNRKAFVAVDKDGDVARKKARDWFERVLGFGPPKAIEAPIAGTPQEVIDKLGEVIETGVDLITLNHWFPPAEFAEQMEIFGSDIIPALTPRK